MFCGFNLKLKEQDILLINHYYNVGKELFDKQKKDIKSSLNKYILEDGSLDESKIEEDWFPSIEADVFLSHSHKDEKLVISFAGWLYELYGIESFIDSCLWGYSDDLLKLIDQKYCVLKRKENGDIDTYNYEKRNRSTANVHLILSTALMKMIDNIEALIFINTPNSLNIENDIQENYTLSPWIYNELLISRVIRHKNLSEYRSILEHSATFSELEVRYKVKTNHLYNLSMSELRDLRIYNTTKVPYKILDKLYKSKGILNGKQN